MYDGGDQRSLPNDHDYLRDVARSLGNIEKRFEERLSDADAERQELRNGIIEERKAADKRFSEHQVFMDRLLDMRLAPVVQRLGDLNVQVARQNGRIGKLEKLMWTTGGAIGVIALLEIGSATGGPFGQLLALLGKLLGLP